MKSKPSNKKLKVEVTNLGPPATTPEKGTNATPALSPAGSTTSTTSSLLSIGPPSYTLSIRPAPDAGAGSTVVSATPAKASNSKAKGGAGNAKDKDAAKGLLSTDQALAGGHPSLSKLTHFNLVEFPKINACIVGSKGGVPAAPSPGPGGVATSTPGVIDINKPIAKDNLTMEDMDSLQAELETLWSNVANRIRLLHREQAALMSSSGSSVHHHNLGLEHFDPQHQEKIASVASIIDHGTRTSVSAAAKLVMGVQLGSGNSPVPSPSPAAQTIVPTAGTKRSAKTKGESLPKKKLKGEGAGGGKSKKSGDKPAARATQNRSHSVSSDFGAPIEGGTVNKHHEVPSQFWESIESYCRDLTKEDVDGVAGILDEYFGDLPSEIFDIPPLGKHYKDEEETAKTKARESREKSSKDCVGPLTQRLVSALVDERVSMFNNNHLNSPKEDASLAISANNNPEGGYFIHRQGLVKALGLDSGGGGASTPSLENRIRDCLVDHGLLPPDDANDPILLNPEDELLAEIKRTQSVLKKLHSYNIEKLNAVIETGKRAIDRYNQKKELDKADKDVYEAYKTIAANKIKKKQVTKKEKDSATKSLESRKRVLLKLESIRGHHDNGISSSSYSSRNGGSGSALSAAVAPFDPTAMGDLRVQV